MTKVSPRISTSGGLAREAAIEKLRDHTFFIKCDPHLVSFEAKPSPAWDSYDLPKGVRPLSPPQVAVYAVKDNYENPIMGSEINSTYEFVATADGFWVRARSPMGTTMESTFTVRAAGDGSGDLEVVQVCDCRCNKALMSIVKKDLDKNYTLIHETLAQRIGQT
ncbi:hypothetical protein PG994_003072 [Apiospora phragmitis]|uniref:DUF7053 domain-containing protein n=1 Tax=Apiospora phragmitis TaxID=2905665 RepID=A0ABR1W9W8_9PEZI